MTVLLANVPTMLCAAIAGALAYTGHPWFGGFSLLLAFNLAHGIQRKDDA